MGRSGRDVLVVGVDESATGDAAPRHALVEAVRRGASMRSVIVWPAAMPRGRVSPSTARSSPCSTPFPVGPIARFAAGPEETP